MTGKDLSNMILRALQNKEELHKNELGMVKKIKGTKYSLLGFIWVSIYRHYHYNF